ncbi:hypothetical protein [Agromyces sp. C10]|uniref:hypothetical protein n=1 Tax=Agromyces sp. C10 TaxID=2935077 RepID=UPI00200A9CDE|nr:hypothetical protein [Agromyces sp. C10]MCK8610280.1 hypothetical protein [Agromyces sp. C10]
MSLRPGVEAVRRATAGTRHPLVLVDGPSGAGKTTFAAALARALPGRPPRVVRVDEAIPGWRGLHRGALELGRSLLAPHARGAAGVVHRWDWLEDRPGVDLRIRPDAPLIIEGCGAFAAGGDRSGAVRVWLAAPYPTRRRRALDRDLGAFDAHWDAWEADWRRHVGRTGHRAAQGAHVTVRLAP